MPLMIPRDRAGQDSMARAAPAGHSAPMPMPSSARKRNRNQKLGAKPAMKLQSEYHAIDEPARPARTDETHPQRNREDSGHFRQGDAELFGDRHHDQQEYREVERVQCPA